MSLNRLTHGDENVAKSWIRNHNTALCAVPLELMKTLGGLQKVDEYLDHARGQ
jgi:hypothetical protein